MYTAEKETSLKRNRKERVAEFKKIYDNSEQHFSLQKYVKYVKSFYFFVDTKTINKLKRI